MKESKFLSRSLFMTIEEKLTLTFATTRLWHQLTITILDFFGEEGSAPYHISIFQNFVAEWEDKINKLSLVTIALKAASQFTGKLLQLQVNIERLALLIRVMMRLTMKIYYRFTRIRRLFE
jgi:hypothetical protein